MGKAKSSPSSKLRKRLNHPVIDTDGHMVELFPVIFDYIKQVGGPEMSEKMFTSLRRQNNRSWYEMDHAQRRHHNLIRPAFWAAPAENTTDLATAMLPKLMHERLPEMGIDYAVVYPTIGFLLPEIADDEVRRAACRAHNLMMADIYRGFEDRLTPAAVIPCHTPDEAIEELDFALGELNFKVPMFINLVKRPIGAVEEVDPDLRPYAFWVDTLAIDSIYDYDPLWQRCMDLKVPVTAHAVGQGMHMRRSISNYMYNQTGHFADAGHAFAKALFFGGVTHRFPELNFAFLECGVAWGASLVCDLKERWEKRSAEAIEQFNPAKIDRELMGSLFERYGGEVLSGRLPEGAILRNVVERDGVDDFAAANVNSIDDLLDRLVPNFYYGCEADDRMNVTAFDTRVLPGGRKLNAMFSSDFGHWDVTDMSGVLVEAHELVEDGLLSDEDFADFVFHNPARLFAGMDPDFFAGTAVEGEVAKMLANGGQVAAA
ncbi:MAG: amidohydrolase family protein [Gammaproteobacteria bacterium]|nr:amidohydrolase family protein [Gammaproteobacteria bacterium]